MAEKPILFNTEMVRAILSGRKTQTRRAVKPQPTYCANSGFSWKGHSYGTDSPPTIKGAAYNFRCMAPYQPGDVLWVRETWNGCKFTGAIAGVKYWYKADCDDPDEKWRPSIHMPRAAARIFLRVTGVRIERLQDISGEDCVAEGCDADMLSEVGEDFIRGVFNGIWDSTIKEKDFPRFGWDANPWVWVIAFERMEVQNG